MSDINSRFWRYIEGFIGFVVIMLAVNYLITIYDLSYLWVLILTFPMLAIDWIFVSTKPVVSAIIVAKRQWVALVIVIVSTLLCLGLLFWAFIQHIPMPCSLFVISQCILTGTLVGVVIRMLVGSFFMLTLIGEPMKSQKILLLLGFVMALWLFPIGETQISCAAYYILGIGIGYAVHFSLRTEQRGRAQRERLKQNLLKMLDEPKMENFTRIENQAIEYCANQKFKKLDKLIRDYRNDKHELSNTLIILNATMQRSQGNYPDCLNTIETELSNSKRDKTLDAMLHCCHALCLSEIEGRREKMMEALRQALNIRSKEGKECILSKITCGLRLAEELPLLPNEEDTRDREAPLNEIWKALRLNAKEIPVGVIDKAIGISIPVTWTFLLDSYGYALLKAGDLRLSRSLFTQCIHEDPNFSSPYLHLGEWYLTQGARVSKDKNLKTQERATELARFCFYIAKLFEGKRDSLIKRRANDKLSETGK